MVPVSKDLVQVQQYMVSVQFHAVDSCPVLVYTLPESPDKQEASVGPRSGLAGPEYSMIDSQSSHFVVKDGVYPLRRSAQFNVDLPLGSSTLNSGP